MREVTLPLLVSPTCGRRTRSRSPRARRARYCVYSVSVCVCVCEYPSLPVLFRAPLANICHTDITYRPHFWIRDTQLVGAKYDAQRFFVRSDRLKEIVAASFPFLLRLGSGALTHGWRLTLEKDDPSKYAFARFGGYMTVEKSAVSTFARPVKPIQLYEFEGCPFCRKVREAVAILDLDVEFKPCPMNGPNFRQEAIKKGGKRQFPYLVDPNSDTAMYESDDIINYLYDKYGPGAAQVC